MRGKTRQLRSWSVARLTSKEAGETPNAIYFFESYGFCSVNNRPAPKARKRIAPGKRSAAWGNGRGATSPGRGGRLFWRPCRGLLFAILTPGCVQGPGGPFACPGLLAVAPPARESLTWFHRSIRAHAFHECSKVTA